ncbi:MAG: hypothetical protein U0237_13625 [Thermoleophilia bacterium]
MKVDLDGERAFIAAISDRVRAFAASRDCETPAVRATLANGENFLLSAMEPEPGGGMITLSPIPEDLSELVQSAPGQWVTPTQLIVRISDIRTLELLAEAPEAVHVGFQLRD